MAISLEIIYMKCYMGVTCNDLNDIFCCCFYISIKRFPNCVNICLNMKNNRSMKKIKNSENVILQPIHWYACGINSRSERSLVQSDLLLAKMYLIEFDRNMLIARKVNILSQLVFIQQTQDYP